MTRKPGKLLAIAVMFGVVQFLSGAPAITESTGWWPPVVIWIGFGFGVAAVVFLILAIRGLFVRRSAQV